MACFETDPISLHYSLPGREVPLLIDSPHSGSHYPVDFQYSVDFRRLRMAEDLFVNQLYKNAPQFGATLLSANFPRSYLDVNRRIDDIDLQLLGPCAQPTIDTTSAKSKLGMGLVWRLLAGEPIYSRFLSHIEIATRIATCYWPYCNALHQEADRLHEKFGRLLHLNVHSMPDDSRRHLGLPDAPLADVVLGNLDGLTCKDSTMETIGQVFLDHGFSVATNDPFKGVDIIREMSTAALGRESVQIEVKKSLYADVETHTFNKSSQKLNAAIDDLLENLRSRLRSGTI
jgi:N-formylglutamate deformylase